MSLIDALWNDPYAQPHVDFTISGLTWISLGTPVAAWKVPGHPDLSVGDQIIIEGVTGAQAGILNGRFIITFLDNTTSGLDTQIRYVIRQTVEAPTADSSSGRVTLTRLSFERIFIAQRSDQQLGSGTQEDPFQGGTSPDVSIAGAVTYDSRQVVISTAQDHGYSPGEFIKITAFRESSGSPFNGVFEITILSKRKFLFRLSDAANPTPLPPPTLTAIVSRRRNAESDALILADGELFWPVLKFTPNTGNHGYDDREIVQVSAASDDAVNGVYPIFNDVTSGGYFYFSPLTAPSDTGPFSAKCARIRFLFDEVMRASKPKMTIHIGPGLFLTRGSGGALIPGGWRVKTGQKIIGSGMGVTTLKQVGASVGGQHYQTVDAEIGEFMDGFEMSDLTVDCNAEGQTSRFVATGVVALRGGNRHACIRRVRAINFGTRTPNGYVENYPFVGGASLGSETYDTVFEDCIAEWPAHNNYWNTTVFNLGGGENAGGDGVTAYSRAGVVRNCYVNCEYNYGPKSRITAVSYDSTTGNPTSGEVTVETAAPHGKTVPGNVLVQGLTLGGAFDNHFNGVFEISSIDGADPNKLTIKGPIGESMSPAVGAGTLGGGQRSHSIRIKRIEMPDASDPYRVHITTYEPHYRTSNNNAYLNGIIKSDKATVSGSFNGVFPVVQYDPASPCELECRLFRPRDDYFPPDAPPTTLATALDLTYAVINIYSQASATEPATTSVVEGNSVLHCDSGGPYQDTFVSRDLVARNNYYYGVTFGPFQNRGGASFWTFGGTPLDTLAYNDTTDIATAHTNRPHGLMVGDYVTIFVVAGYNVGVQVKNVPDAKTFEFSPGAEPPLKPPNEVQFRPGLGQLYDSRRPLESLHKQYDAAIQKWLMTAVMAPIPEPGGSQKHDMEKGAAFEIQHGGVWNAIASSPFHMKSYRVVAVPSESEFQFYLDTDPGQVTGDDPDTETFCLGYFGRLSGDKNLTIESNVIELAIRNLGEIYVDQSGALRSIGIYMYSVNFSPQYRFRNLVLRNNIIRHVDNRASAHYLDRGIEVYNAENVLVQNNVIRLDYFAPIDVLFHPGFPVNNTVTTFGNQTPAGDPILGFINYGVLKSPDVVRDVGARFEEVVSLAMLQI